MGAARGRSAKIASVAKRLSSFAANRGTPVVASDIATTSTPAPRARGRRPITEDSRAVQRTLEARHRRRRARAEPLDVLRRSATAKPTSTSRWSASRTAIRRSRRATPACRSSPTPRSPRSRRPARKPQVFGTPTISDGMSMGTEGMKYSLVSREVIADCIETAVKGQWMDGVRRRSAAATRTCRAA